MYAATTTALIAHLGSILVAVVTYWTTKQGEREAEWRKEKLAYYKSFIESLSDVIDGDDTPEGQNAYAKTTSNLLLFAPQNVIVALNEFREEIRKSTANRTQENHDKLLATLLLAVRRDIGMIPNGDSSTFRPVLWASGVDKSGA